ncbi:hypothetical protein SteCoe_2679 [Stentor coeruleus]|uniref:SAM domain-containing protein n=1 Tax=Stentor coeruleus TaxID=5963 RepID=A0A1R2CYX7_9CILI|nr:hypothetical protein SteCoe_2679 [Stentor coeruleus]
MSTQNEAFDFRCASASIIIGDYYQFQYIVSQNPILTNEKDFGETLLHIAADNNQFEITEFLLTLGVNPDIKNNSGESALHLAVFRSSKRIVDLLLSHKANPNILTDDLRSPLHYAAEFKEPELIKALLLHGASPSLLDINGLTPIDLAGELTEMFPKRSPIPIKIEQSPTDELNTTINTLNLSALKTSTNDNRLKTKRNSYKEDLYIFLQSLSLENHYKAMVSGGFDNLQALVFQMKTHNPITHKILKSIGIDAYGDRSRIIVNLEKLSIEAAPRYEFVTLDEFLDEIDLGCYYQSFVANGLENIEKIFKNTNNGNGLTDDLLKSKLSIEKLGHRIRLIGITEYFSKIYFKNKCMCMCILL